MPGKIDKLIDRILNSYSESEFKSIQRGLRREINTTVKKLTGRSRKAQ
jgi:hypothetical protein